MFVHVKKVGTYRYLQIAENRREGKRVKQSVIATLGRLDKLPASGAIDQLLRSAARFAERVMGLSEHSSDAHDSPDTKVVSVGPALIFEGLWRETVCQEVVSKLLAKAEKGAFMIDLDKARDEERFDGMWVLRTNTELTAVEIALRYKQLWMVEQLFRTAKSLVDTRPIFHKTDAIICGHVFCSFLALVLRNELFRRIDNAGVTAEWGDILRDLNALTETTITYNCKTFAVRSNAVGVVGKIAQCVGVRLPNTVRQVDVEEEVADPSP